jgi:hypothetical protein
MAREGTAAWYYEQAIRLRVLAAKATNPQIQFELLQAATRFRTLAAEAEANAKRKQLARESMLAASSAFEVMTGGARMAEPVSEAAACEAKR